LRSKLAKPVAFRVVFGLPIFPMPTQTPQETLTAPTDPEQRTNWFTATPDPWREIARLSFGGDRTFASTVERMIVSAEPAQRPAMEKKLLAALGEPELTGAGRLFICRMLGLVGSAACVPAVEPLLRSDRTADVARLALDPIWDPAVDEAYRGALGSLHGSARAGLIGSIGLRGDANAVEALTAIATNSGESPMVRTAAQRAVKRIGRKAVSA
jgi:hypothetical protein